MAATKGDILLPFSIETGTKQLLDKKMYVENHSDLITYTTDRYLFKMPVFVAGLDDATKMGWWLLNDPENPSNPLSWIRGNEPVPFNQVIQVGTFSLNEITYIATLDGWAFNENGVAFEPAIVNNLAFTAPDATYPRADIVVWDSVNGFVVERGTPAANYSIPNTPTGTILVQTVIRNVDGSTEAIEPGLSVYAKLAGGNSFTGEQSFVERVKIYGDIFLDEPSIRSWVIKPFGGKLHIDSGDELSSVDFNTTPTVNGVAIGGGAVDSVNTQVGVVVLDADDISDASTINKFVTVADITKLSNTSGTNTGDQDLSNLISGTLTTHYIQKSTGPNSIGDSKIIERIINPALSYFGFGSALVPGELIHIGDGNILLEGGEEVAQKFKRDFTTTGVNGIVATGSGQSVNPIFQIGRIIQAGDGDPEIRIVYSDDNTVERTVFEVDRKGIAASVKTAVGSHFEGFAGLTDVNPMFRLNSYPRMRLEMGAGGNNVTDVAVERNADGGLSFYTADTNRGGFDIDGDLEIVTEPATSVSAYDILTRDTVSGLVKKVVSSTFVPYTGAVSDVNLGEFGIQLGNLEFDNTPTTIPTTAGSLYWNDTDGTLDLKLKGGNVTLQVGQEQLIRVVNKTGLNLTEAAYSVVYLSGAQGQRPKVDLALSNNSINSAATLGLVTENINNNLEGFITTSGLVRGINTTGSLQGETWVDGNILYVSATVAGKLTNIMPVAPNHKVIVGYIISAHATQGTIFVKVSVGQSIAEINDVDAATALNNEGLFYDSATLTWKHKTVATVLGYTPVGGTGTVNTVPKFTGTGTIGNSQITDNGTDVTISGMVSIARSIPASYNTINFENLSGTGYVQNQFKVGANIANLQYAPGGFLRLVTNEATTPIVLAPNGVTALTVLPSGVSTFANTVTATSLIKSGGTATQFLKADGSTDGSTYLTSSTGVSSITGTASQVIASAATGAVTLSLPQSIATTSTPQFAKIGIGAAANAAAYITTIANTATVGQLYLPPSATDYTGTLSGMTWNNASEWKFYDGVLGTVNRFIKLNGNSILANSNPLNVVTSTGTGGNLGTLKVETSFSRYPTAVSYTVLLTDIGFGWVIGVTDTTAARTITLPLANTVPAGFQLIIKDESGAAGTNAITIARSNTDLIDGATSVVINSNYGSRTLYSDGVTKWFII